LTLTFTFTFYLDVLTVTIAAAEISQCYGKLTSATPALKRFPWALPDSLSIGLMTI
jgi:hypothetical protein